MGGVRHLHFIVVVWGKKYCDTFLNVSLPTQLSPGNLAGLSRPEHAVFRIFTSEHDVERIRRSAAVAALEQHVRVEIETFEMPEVLKKYRFMTRIQMRALREAAERKAVAVFLAPDILVADGSLVALERLADRPAVLIAAPRLNMTTVAPELLLRRGPEPSRAIAIAPRDLVSLAVKHLHPITASAFWGQPWLNAHPTMLYWRLGEQGMLARQFHLHPLLVDPARLSKDFLEQTESMIERRKFTIDGDLMLSMQASPDEFHVVTDSDELAIFELSDETIDHGLIGRKERTTVDDIVAFARLKANPLHRGYLRHRIWFQGGDHSRLESFGEVTAASDALVDKVLHDLQLLPSVWPVKRRKHGWLGSALSAVAQAARQSIRYRFPREARRN